MDFNEINLYGKTNLSSVLKEIHKNSQDKEQELKKLISDIFLLKLNISKLVSTIGVVPL